MVRGIADGTMDEEPAQAAFARQWGCMDAGASVEIAAPQCWQPELVPITVILDAAPEGFSDASAIDLDAIGPPHNRGFRQRRTSCRDRRSRWRAPALVARRYARQGQWRR
jgi:hypothetical protein